MDKRGAGRDAAECPSITGRPLPASRPTKHSPVSNADSAEVEKSLPRATEKLVFRVMCRSEVVHVYILFLNY